MTDTNVSAAAGSLVDGRYSMPSNEPEAPSNELGKDAFLKLLVAQLRYQDPLEPSTSEEFIATTAQFTVVEKLDELTKQGENTALVNSLMTASSLVGREVTALRDGIEVTATVRRSRLDAGQVVLDTDSGEMQMNEIVSVGPAASESNQVVEASETAEVSESATESAETAETVDVSESAESVESTEPDESAETTDTAETTETAESADTAETADTTASTDLV